MENLHGNKRYLNQKLLKYDCFVMRPDQPIRVTWDIFCMFIILYEMIMIPFRISFADESDEFNFLEQIDPIFDFIFLFDIVLNFNTGVYVKGMPTFRRKIIAITYLKLWFWLDILSSFPYSTVITSITRKT
jgi:hypothetical protein